MILTQVLSSLLQDGFASLEDLPSKVRNDVLLELAKLASEGKLSCKRSSVEEKEKSHPSICSSRHARKTLQ